MPAKSGALGISIFFALGLPEIKAKIVGPWCVSQGKKPTWEVSSDLYCTLSRAFCSQSHLSARCQLSVLVVLGLLCSCSHGRVDEACDSDAHLLLIITLHYSMVLPLGCRNDSPAASSWPLPFKCNY